MPVYTPKDYPLIRQLPGADDMPLTGEACGQAFDDGRASLVVDGKATLRRRKRTCEFMRANSRTTWE